MSRLTKLLRHFLFLLLLASPTYVRAQTIPSDSTFLNSLFTENLYSAYWQFPGTWYAYDTVSNLSDMYTKLNTIFPFKESEFEDCYNQIQPADSIQKDNLINPTMNNYFIASAGAYKQLNPLYSIDFSLYGKNAESYFTYTPRTNSAAIKTAFFILPGSNNNQTTEINRGTGYHNLWCYMREFLKSKGDVFVLTKPLEDYRALYRNKKKLNSGDYYTPGANSYIYTYLLGEDKPYGVNYLIEGMALLKYLQSKYDKVVVLGCSQGGYATLITTLFGKTDASVMSSGYSMHFDNSASDIYALQQNFGGLVDNMKDTFVRQQLSRKKTDVLFTYGNNDSYYYQLEHDQHSTQNFFSGVVNNASFFYDYNNHAFPPCNYLDTFLTRVIQKPKIKVADVKECKIDSAHFQCKVIGKLPVVADLYLNSTWLQTITFFSKDSLITLTQPGVYQFKNISDSSLVKGFDGDLFQYKKDTLNSFASSFNAFDCNTQWATYNLSINTNLQDSTILYYHQGGVNNQLVLNPIPTPISFLNNQIVVFDSVSLHQRCTLPLQDSIILAWQTPTLTHSAVSYNCSNFTASMSLQASGDYPPFLLRYTHDNIQDSLWLNTASNFNMTAGYYNLLSLEDVNGCIKNLNEVIPVNFMPLAVQMDTPVFQCDSSKYKVQVHLQGQAPYYFYFRKNATDSMLILNNQDNVLWFDDGLFVFDSVSTATCTISVLPGTTYNFNYTPVTVNSGVLSYNCNTNLASKAVQVNQGEPPYLLYFSLNNLQDSVTLNAGNSSLTQTNGLYHLLKVRDAKQCEYFINQTYSVDYHTIGIAQTDSTYLCDSVKTKFKFALSGNAPYTLYYRSNGINKTISTSSSELSISLGNGLHQLDSLKDATCKLSFTNKSYSLNHTAMVYQPPYVEYNCDSSKTFIRLPVLNGQAPFTVFFSENGVADSLTFFNGNIKWQANNGTYQFLKLTDANGCIKNEYSNLQINFQPLSYSLGALSYSCDSNVSLLPINLQGNPPYTIYYRKNNVNASFTTFLSSYNMKLFNGIYKIDSVVDTKCRKSNGTATYTIQQNSLNCTVQPPVFNCATGVSTAQINFTGNAPFTLHYTINGVGQTISTYSNTYTLNMGNGYYYFNLVTDSTLCSKILSQSYSLNYTLLNVNIQNPVYDCDSNKTKLKFILNGNPSWTIYYRKNGLPQQVTTAQNVFTLYLTNGSYSIDSVKDATCIKTFTSNTYTFNATPLSVITGTPQYICDSNKVKLPFTLQGDAPYTIYYTYNGFNDSLTCTTNFYEALLPNGTYQFGNVKDSKGCQFALNQYYSFNYQPLAFTLDTLPYSCSQNGYPMSLSIVGNSPFVIDYKKDGNLLNANATSNILFNLNNATWEFLNITDALGCTKPINYSKTVNTANPISAAVTQDYYHCVLEKRVLSLLCTGNPPYTLFYRRVGANSLSLTQASAINQMTLALPQGMYMLDSLTDQNGCNYGLNYPVSNLNPALEISPTDSVYDCDSSKLKITYTLQGSAPWTIYFHNVNSGQMGMKTSSSSLLSLWFETGSFVIDSVSDNQCSKTILLPIQNNVMPFNALSMALQLNCDSQKNYITLKSYGGVSPYTYSYNQDGILTNYTTSNDSVLFFMNNNSNYYMLEVKDALNCTYSLNQLYTNQLLIPHLNEIVSNYDCLKDSNKVYFNMDESEGSAIVFTYNGTQTDTLWLNGINQFYLPNGDYHAQSILWEGNCYLPFSWDAQFDNHPMSLKIDSMETSCADQRYILHTSASGKSPWYLSYTFNGDTTISLLNQAVDTLQLVAGKYHFIATDDANFCHLFMDRSDTLNSFLTQNPAITLQNHQLVSNVSDVEHQWFKNDTLLVNETTNAITVQGNGSYYCRLQDDAGCVYQSNIYTVNFDEDIQVFPNPVHQTLYIAVNDVFDFWEYEIHDMFGNRLTQGVSEKANLSLDVSHYQSGTYLIHFKKNGQKSVFRFTKL